MTYIKQNAMHVEMQSTSLVVSIGAVKNHENTPKHLRNFNNNNNKNNNNKNQLQFVVKKKGTVSMESVDKSVIFTTEEQKWKVEILRVLNVAEIRTIPLNCAKKTTCSIQKCFPTLKLPRIMKCL